MEITPDKLEEALRILPKAKKGGTYILQCGSFRDYDDADELKARLALLGIEAQIQTVVIKNGESWHRVRVGPLKGLAAVKPVRRKLKRNDINFVLLKIGG
ncbi:MAG: SPOR domain-containing protein [Gammaproteobacteria bacterium]